MMSVRTTLLALLALPLWAAAADSAELVAGGAGGTPMALGAESRVPLLLSGPLSVGASSAPASALAGSPLPFGVPGRPLAVGGYVAYGGAGAQLSSALRSDGVRGGASLSASWSGGWLGQDSLAALSLGVSRSGWGAISPNTQHQGLTGLMGLDSPLRPESALGMSFSLTHQVSPSFSLGGMAVAGQGGDESRHSLGLGAGLGLRF